MFKQKKYLQSVIMFFLIVIIGLSANTAVYSSTGIITDGAGRKVEVPEEVSRLGTLFAVSGHIVTMLDRGEDIVAVSRGLKRDILLTEICPDILDAVEPKASGSINIEELIKVNPDILFVEKEVGLNDGESAKFEKFQIPYLVVDFNNVEEQQQMIAMIGRVIGAEDEARSYLEYYNEVIKLVSERTASLPEEKKVRVYHSTKEAGRTDTKNSLPADWLKIAGAVNVSVDKELRLVESDKYFANMEQILLWDPDVILVNEDGVDEYIRTDKKWAPLKAVKEDRVYLLPNGVSRWGHHNSLETPLAVLWTAKKLYPQLFEDIDMVKETKDFYREFFEVDLSTDEVKKVLAGKGMRKEKT